MLLTVPPDPLLTIRRWLLALVVLGLVGTGTELVLLAHYEDSAQLVPLFFIALTLVAIAGHLAVGGAGSLLLLRAMMCILVAAGLLGVVLHYRGSMEFQLEMDPTLSGWPLLVKVLHAKAPPTLAPGVMAQLGLLGLVYTYRHPAGHSSS
jgi:hypothetical protein